MGGQCGRCVGSDPVGLVILVGCEPSAAGRTIS